MNEQEEIEHIHKWTLKNENKSVCSVIYSLFQGFFCISNMIFGNYILLFYRKNIIEDKNLLVALSVTLFGELLIHVSSILLILLVRVCCGIRSSAYFVSIAGLLNMVLQSCFYYICFGISMLTIGTWYFGSGQNNGFLSHFEMKYANKDTEFTHIVVLYFVIEAFISFNEILHNIPLVVSAVGYGLSKEINKMKGKPVVEFHKLDKPITFTRYQNYEEALNHLKNNSPIKPENCYLEL